MRSSHLRPPRVSLGEMPLRRGEVVPERLPQSKAVLAEDHYCPHRCGGTMLITPEGDCTCHIIAPCGACESAYLECSECGYEYRNTREDNAIVEVLIHRNRESMKKPKVDVEPFALYDIFRSKPRRR
jgi:hypothetical protein